MKTRTALSAFSLLELLVVTGLIAVLLVFSGGGLAEGGRAAALQNAQATLASLVTAARTRALASGRTTRLLINHNPGNTDCYRRQLVLAELSGGEWSGLHSLHLPAGIYLLPRNSRIPPGMFPDANEWMTASGSARLGSSTLDATVHHFSHDTGAPEEWEFVGFTARGTVETNQGSLVLALGRRLAPSGLGAGGSPVVMVEPQDVRGIQLSTYGIPRLINDRTGF